MPVQKKQSDKLQRKLSEKLQMDNETTEKCIQWLRNSRRLDTYSGVTRGRRIDYFKGDEFVDTLCSKKFTKKKFLDAPLTRSEAISVGNLMLQRQDFHHSEQMNQPKKLDDDAVQIIPHRTKNKLIDEDEAVYTWIIPASHTRVYIQSGLFLCGALFLCMFKVWPLALKIFVWWCSLILLITMSVLFVIRLIFAAIFWIFGFRGLWLLPNLFNDEIDTLETFTPLIGYGIDSKKGRKEARRIAKEEKAEEAAKKKVKGKKKEKKEEKDENKPKETVIEGRFSDCNFGLINMLVIAIIAIVCCNHLGLFMGENIPDFVVSQNELWRRFPGLAPPNASQPIINEANNVEIPEVEEEEEGIDMSKFINEVEEEEDIIDDLDDIDDNDSGDNEGDGNKKSGTSEKNDL